MATIVLQARRVGAWVKDVPTLGLLMGCLDQPIRCGNSTPRFQPQDKIRLARINAGHGLSTLSQLAFPELPFGQAIKLLSDIERGNVYPTPECMAAIDAAIGEQTR
jgi:hypothetical protein